MYPLRRCMSVALSSALPWGDDSQVVTCDQEKSLNSFFLKWCCTPCCCHRRWEWYLRWFFFWFWFVCSLVRHLVEQIVNERWSLINMACSVTFWCVVSPIGCCLGRVYLDQNIPYNMQKERDWEIRQTISGHTPDKAGMIRQCRATRQTVLFRL